MLSIRKIPVYLYQKVKAGFHLRCILPYKRKKTEQVVTGKQFQCQIVRIMHKYWQKKIEVCLKIACGKKSFSPFSKVIQIVFF